MTGTHQLWSLGLMKSSKEEEWRCYHAHKKSRHTPHELLCKESFGDRLQVGPAYPPPFNQKVTKKSWVAEELRRRGPVVSKKKKKVIRRDKALLKNEVTAFKGLLRACAKNKDLSRGITIHDDILKRGLLKKCSDPLATMYAKCGALTKSKELLYMHQSRDVSSWTALIAGYARRRQSQEALNCFERMQRESLSPNAVTFACILKACGNMRKFDKGKQIHDEIARQGLLGNDVVLGTALVDMYAKCGALEKAQRVLEELPSRDVVCWGALIAGYAQHGQGEQALICLECMRHEGLSPDAMTFACILKACGTIGAADKGEEIHDEIVRQGLLGNDIVLGTALIDMYAKCGSFAKAQRVLEELPSRDVVSWSALITGYAQQGQGEQALKCFERMQLEGLSPNAQTFACILIACGSIKAAEKGKQIHDEIARQGLLENDVVLGNALVDMYVKCGNLAKAQRVVDELPSRDVVTWSALIAGYTLQGEGEQALNCFERMQHEGLSPDLTTIACILRACGTIGAEDKGDQIHDKIEREGLLRNNIMLGTALVDMYAKCGALTKAHRVFEDLPGRDAFSWNVLIAGYAQQGQGEQAVNCFEQMQREGLSPNAMTFASILKACGAIGAVDKGEQIHDEIVKQGLLGNDIVLGNALVDMYAKCGALVKAQELLEELPSWDVVSWNAVIAGYTQQGQGEQALSCFEQMQCKGLSPDEVTFLCLLKACGTIGAADQGKKIHDRIARQGLLESSAVLGTALVDMYAKCGALTIAERVLEELPSRDGVSWNALIAGYAQQSQGREALNCFERMQREGFHPDAATFSCVLNVCSHLGLVEDCHMYFEDMSTKYGVKPDLEHYTCMVDLYARAGHVEKAARMIQEMPSSDHSVLWRALLGACRKWGDVNVGRWAFEQALQIDKSDGAAYVLMANIYMAVGMQEDAGKIEAMRMENIALKKPGSLLWIDMSGNAHACFVEGFEACTKQISLCDARGYYT